LDTGLAVSLSVVAFLCLLAIIGFLLWKRFHGGHRSTASAISYVVEAQSDLCDGVSDSDWDVPVDPYRENLWSGDSGGDFGTFHPLRVEEGI
jgi:hypothetical protein